MAREFWKAIGEPKVILAPMVAASELAFREFARRYGGFRTTVCPMLHARSYLQSPTFRCEMMFETEDAEGRRPPVIAQLAGDSPAAMAEAAALVAPHVVAVDVNLGCPQAVARRGHYGAFLLDEEERENLLEIVRAMKAALEGSGVYLTCKIRILPSLEGTVRLAKDLVAAGAAGLTVHGRTRDMKGPNVRASDWESIRHIVENVDVPVIANGGVRTAADVEECLRVSGARAVMVSEASLDCVDCVSESGAVVPRSILEREIDEKDDMFFGDGIPAETPRGTIMFPEEMVADEETAWKIARERTLLRRGEADALDLALAFLDVCEETGNTSTMVMSHMFRMLHIGTSVHNGVRAALIAATKEIQEDIDTLVGELGEKSVFSPHLWVAGGDIDRAVELAAVDLDSVEMRRRVAFAPAVSVTDFVHSRTTVVRDATPLLNPDKSLGPEFPPGLARASALKGTRPKHAIKAALNWHAPGAKPNRAMKKFYNRMRQAVRHLRLRIQQQGPILAYVKPIDPEHLSQTSHSNPASSASDATSPDGRWILFPQDGSGWYFRHRLVLPNPSPDARSEQQRVFELVGQTRGTVRQKTLKKEKLAAKKSRKRPEKPPHTDDAPSDTPKRPRI